jgi:hypothetical protein
MDNSAAFDVLKWVAEDPAFAQELLTNPDEALTRRGVWQPEGHAELKQLVAAFISSPLATAGTGATYPKQQESTLETAESFKNGLRNTVAQIERGFRSTMMMYEVAFYLGVGLILAAVVMAFFKEQNLLPIAFGSLGILDVIA